MVGAGLALQRACVRGTLKYPMLDSRLPTYLYVKVASLARLLHWHLSVYGQSLACCGYGVGYAAMVTQKSSGESPVSHSSTRARRPPVNALLMLLLVFVSGTLLCTSASDPHPAHATAGSNSALSTSGCDQPPPFPAGTSHDASLVAGGRQRSYRVHIPVHYRPSHQYPLVLNFHGHGSSAAQQENYTGFSQLADRQGFVVAYPQGIVGPDQHTGWSSGGVGKPQVNDVLFASDLISRLQGMLCIDPLRIYATGFSNGGGMTSLLACRLANRIAAFAPVSGSYYVPVGGCHPARPVSILEIHGTGDTIVPYDGNSTIGLVGSETLAQTWALRDACSQKPETASLGNGVTSFTWTDCADHVTAAHYRVLHGKHVWPGSSSLKQVPAGDVNLDASALIWSFFVAHPLLSTRVVSAQGAHAASGPRTS